MFTSIRTKTNKICLTSFFVALFVALVLCGCNGDGGGADSGTSGGSSATGGDSSASAWKASKLQQLDASGLLTPNITALSDKAGKVHIAYFSESEGDDRTYDISYLVFDMAQIASLADAEPELVANIDNCRTLALALDEYDLPAIAYRGGTVRECGAEQQSDAMFSIRDNATWYEYTGAVGVVERNPVFKDGLAGTNVSLVFDSNTDIHIAYQFLYEGCDSMNYQYPDLFYVKETRTALDDSAPEEQVEGNQYGGLNIQNNVGSHNTIVMDTQDSPILFYSAELSDNTIGLRVARRLGDGTWEKEWIETGCDVGGISGALDHNGNLAVAYYVERYTDGTDDVHLLKYAQKESSAWTVQIVDDSTLCGKYPSLSFDSSGYPAIAYYEIETYGGRQLKNLKLARFNGSSWTDKEVVASAGDVGLYNALWFDDSDKPVISSYSNTENAIYLFYKE